MTGISSHWRCRQEMRTAVASVGNTSTNRSELNGTQPNMGRHLTYLKSQVTFALRVEGVEQTGGITRAICNK